MGAQMDEFAVIDALLRPLARGFPGAFDLTDDAALLTDKAGRGLVITTDTLVEGTHFLPDDPPATVGAKLVRVNLSDMIAKGAVPVAALLNLTWPRGEGAGRGPGALEAFVGGLAADLAGLCGDIPLIGGDTTTTSGPMVAGLTLIGSPCGARPVLRRGASPGDVVCVTGTIGDAGLGLEVLARGLITEGAEALVAAYRTPAPPPLGFAQLVAEGARAALDVSDGLLADAAHLARASGVAVLLDLDLLPLSEAGHGWLAGQPDPLAAAAWLAGRGDDYQTLLACRPGDLPRLQAGAEALGTSLTRIGACRSGETVIPRWGGEPVELGSLARGWRHRI
jgi:thiamine-monophosphate kinase